MSDEKHGPEASSASKHRGPDRSSPYPVSRLSGAVSLVDVAREIERADQFIASTSGAKLEQIAQQMKALRLQAEQVLRDAHENTELHRAEARFQRQAGKTYHLYERAPGERYWSMLSPADWAGRAPHPFVGSYRLEADQSWTPAERAVQRDQERAPLMQWLARGMSGELAHPLDINQLPAQPTPPESSEKDTPCESSSSPPSDPTGRA
jgi:hypothetical protein